MEEDQTHHTHSIDSLKDDIQSFEKEHQQVQSLIKAIKGRQNLWVDKIVNLLFLIAVVGLFFGGLLLDDWLNPLFLIELSVLLVSGKIIWMIYRNHKFNHFTFWVLSTLESKLDAIAQKIDKLDNNRSGK